ncbi:MAG: prolipoprotein diacylglyceryl transferase [candidate division KSB1 bacterium]|nr:prolipoprotein diacylglyceryl transferase [candidate division KSB1 bacterium]
MHPVLFRIGPLQLHSYGVMLAIGFAAGIWITVRRAPRYGIERNTVMDLATVIILSAIIGSRAMYVVFHLDEFRGHWADTFSPFQSTGEFGLAGLTFLGGLLLALGSSFLYVRWKKLPFLRVADLVMPAMALGLFFGRIGCFLNGCCFGLPCSGPLCVVFPPESPAGATFPGTPIYPTQLFSSMGALGIFGLLLVLERHRRFDGFVFYGALILYGLGRFTIDFLRYYESQMLVVQWGNVHVSVNQLISLGLALSGAGMLWVNLRRKKPAGGSPSAR